MCNNIPKRDHRSPFYFGIRLFNIIRNISSSLTNDLKVANDCIIGTFIMNELS